MQTSDASASRSPGWTLALRRLVTCAAVAGALAACGGSSADPTQDAAVTSDVISDTSEADSLGGGAARWGEARYGEGRFAP